MQMTTMKRVRIAATRGAIFLLCFTKLAYYPLILAKSPSLERADTTHFATDWSDPNWPMVTLPLHEWLGLSARARWLFAIGRVQVVLDICLVVLLLAQRRAFRPRVDQGHLRGQSDGTLMP